MYFLQVYKASWHGTDVAVKELKDGDAELTLEHELPGDVDESRVEQQRQFEHEAALLSTLRHPNIVNFLAFICDGARVSLAPSVSCGAAHFWILHARCTHLQLHSGDVDLRTPWGHTLDVESQGIIFWLERR